MDILRFITAGSVDDGKSTLIGRMLYDNKSIFDDQLEALQKASKSRSNGELDLALLTDGLRSEREQGITIDVAYKYFNTQKRKFIIADTPGHIQYTRNMVTGASNSNLAIILVDARNGVIEQTRRHTYICSLLGIRHFVVAINKMDLVDYSEDAFANIVADYQSFAKNLNLPDLTFIPVSALNGDNIVKPSENMTWYSGKPLLQYLEEVPLEEDINLKDTRFQVQYVIRPQSAELPDYRGYAGRVQSGVYRKGDEITVLPSGLSSKIKSVEFAQKEVEEAYPPMSVILHLEDDIDISRGDSIIKKEEASTNVQNLEAEICWMDSKALINGGKYLLQHHSNIVKCAIKSIEYTVNINTMEKNVDAKNFQLNDIGKVTIKTAKALGIDAYKDNLSNGSFILIDPSTNATAGAGMVTKVS